jgi:hypothetical protein
MAFTLVATSTGMTAIASDGTQTASDAAEWRDRGCRRARLGAR